MTNSAKLQAGALFPAFAWPRAGGGSSTPGVGVDWRLLVIYRGAHCPICAKYLRELSDLESELDRLSVRVWALSSDPLERAEAFAAREDLGVPILAELKESEMRALGLYISEPRSPQETDRNFAEPGLFVINPEGKVQIVDVSNAPFARPDLKSLLGEIGFVITNDYPIRGTAA